MLIIQSSLKLLLEINKEEGTVKKKVINKRSVTLAILMTFIVSIFNLGICVNAAESLMMTNRLVPVSNVNEGDTFDVTYTITPNAIPVSSQNNNKQKDIVFVIDTSGSMDWIVGQNREAYSNEKSRLRIIQNVAENFINKFNDGKNQANISIVEYNNYASKITNDFININSDNINSLTGKYGYIESLSADGSTNIGDGLRKAYYQLSSKANDGKDKYIVLMTDGEAEAYSYKNGNYYMDNGTYNYAYTSWNRSHTYANPDYRQESMEYAKKVASELIANPNDNLNINTFVIGFGNGADGDKNKQIADATKGTYFQAQDENTISTVYDKIQKIIDTNVNGKVHLEENISSNLDVVEVKNKDLPQDYKIDNNKLIIDVNNYYTLTNGNYHADPIEFTVKYKVNDKFKDNNICKLGAGGNSSFVNLDVLGKTDTKYLVEKILGASGTGVKMEVSDSSGTINEKYDSTINDLDYNVDNNGEPYKLYGQSNAAIDVKDENATHLKYRFVKDGQTPSEDDWQYIALNGDVNTSSPGYLTQMPYDVSHMPLMSNDAMWSNRNEVYKTPFADKTGLISTGITDSNTHYVTSENVRDKDGNSIIRWVPKTLFVKDQWVEGYASGYKEARKTWGYIKVDQTGDYYLKAFSDDGFYGTITVNGEAKVLGNDFSPRGVNDGGLNATNAIHLEEGVYYPIYLEYFNWGGRAAFEIQASLNGQNNYKLIGSANSHFTLYPSNSDSPIENGNNIFMGSNTINFKTEPGIYTIQYALLKEKDTSSTGQIEYDEISRGSFGKFEVEERFDGLSKAFSKDRVQQGETFNINYTVKPKPIKLTDLYKGKDSSNKPDSLYVKNLILTDKLPQGLERADGTDSNDKSIINRVTDIEYKYNAQTNEYEANEYIFSVNVKLISQRLDNINFTQSGQIDYRDISLKDDSRISQTQYFSNVPTLGGNSLIIKHGLYNGNEVNITETESNEFNVSDGIPVTLAIVVQANSSNPAINLSIDTSKIPQGTIEFKMYKISDSDNGTIDSSITPTEVELANTGSTDLTGFTMERGHKYLIVYTVTPSGSGETTVTATADEISPKSVDLNISPKPDLF
ncbi:hypothetical protein CBEIBR21_03430 [Clostridium beijerinckii]|uniref:Uncharacterized protein n=1 Tax=Clostridium beijerinckii TaxID=1520 RepID=A0A1S9NCP0_CLOBE|nr:hypothetical protein CBEIBR21_03430 [Clostridium beijerinckii]